MNKQSCLYIGTIAWKKDGKLDKDWEWTIAKTNLGATRAILAKCRNYPRYTNATHLRVISLEIMGAEANKNKLLYSIGYPGIGVWDCIITKQR